MNLSTSDAGKDFTGGTASNDGQTLEVMKSRIERPPLSDDRAPSLSDACYDVAHLIPRRPDTRRSSSYSQVELASKDLWYHGVSVAPRNETLPSRRGSQDIQHEQRRSRHLKSNKSSRRDSHAESITSNFKWYARPESISDLHLSGKHLQVKKCPERPLKTCLKTQAHSTSTTPLGQTCGPSTQDTDIRILRRVKTVAFEKQSKSMLAISPSTEKGYRGNALFGGPALTNRFLNDTKIQRNRTKEYFPYLLNTCKSTLADPALTHTDVHVVAIPYCQRSNNKPLEEANDSEIPTIQTVDSHTGTYTIIWDETFSEDPRRPLRQASSTDQSLGTCSSAAVNSLQQVNCRLKDWSERCSENSVAYRPSIVVYPDEDSHEQISGLASRGSEDFTIFAPPNSHETSTQTSRPASTPITRCPSTETLYSDEAITDFPWEVPTDHALIMPGLEAQPGPQIGLNRRVKELATARKFSIVEEDELKFRSHRDSVTLAHSRLTPYGGISPSQFMHRDSVSMARRRIRAKGHATSAPRDIPQSSESLTSEASVSHDDDLNSIVSLTVIKEHAAQALKNKKSASILCSEPPNPDRHIRIVE